MADYVFLTSAQIQSIHQLYVSYFNRAADVDGINYWADDYLAQLNAGKTDAQILAGMSANFALSTEYKNTYHSGQSVEAFIQAIYSNVLGRAAEAAAVSYWGPQLSAGTIAKSDFILAIVNAVNAGSSVADKAYLDARVADSIDAVESDPAFSTTFKLTVGQDSLEGTALADTFVAKVVQNANGEQTNQLATGDDIDGGAGIDTLNATVQAASALNTVAGSGIAPETVDVEVVNFTALDASEAGGEGVVINAKSMLGLDEISSTQSDVSLIVHNLTTLTDSGVYAERRNTEEVTIRMDHTGNDAAVDQEADLTVLFDNDYLVSDSSSTSTLQLRMVNAYSLAEADQPLVGFTSVEFLVGTTVVNVEVTAAMRALTGSAAYQALADAIEDKLDALNITDVTVTLMAERDAVFTDDVGTYEQGEDAGSYSPILLTSSGETLGRGNTATDNSTVNANFLNTQTPTSSTEENPITATVELFKVGRGAEGGDLTIGGMSTDGNNEWDYSADAIEEGVQVFNVTVEGDQTQFSSLASLQSTNNTLEEVNVAWATGSVADLIIGNHNTTAAASGYLAAAIAAPGVTTLENYALKDVLVFNAANNNSATLANGTVVTNDVELHASISDEAVAKYMDLSDTAQDSAADNADFEYTFGAGNDLLNINISNSNLAQSGTTNREDFSLTIETGAGNDTVETQIGTGEGVGTEAWYINSKQQDNLDINTGAGDDTVRTYGAGSWDINAGAGDDVVYSDNSGAQKAVWVFNTANQTAALSAARDIDDLVSDTNGEHSLLKSTVTVSLRGVTASIVVEDYNSTDTDLNNIIKSIIAADEHLSDLVVATDGPGNTLVITSLVDGEFVAADLVVTVTAPTSTDLGTLTSTQITAFNTANGTAYTTTADILAHIQADVAALNAGTDYDTAMANDGVADVNGAVSGAATASVIVDGAGEDTIVLSTSSLDTEVVNLTADGASDVIFNVTQATITGLQVNDIVVTSNGFTYTNLIGTASFDITGASSLNITGTAGADTLKATAAGAVETLTGAAGADTFVFGNGVSTLVAATADIITDFVSGTDKLSLGLAGDATAGTGNYVELANAADFAAALAAANTALATLAGSSAAAELYAFVSDGTDGFLFNDTDGDGDADQAIILVGTLANEIAATDIIA